MSVFEVVNERKRRNCCLVGGLTLNDGWKKEVVKFGGTYTTN